MSLKRIKQLSIDFEKAMRKLKIALAQDPLQAGGVVLDGTIQRFEFCFELAWKTAKGILEYKGIESGNPRDVIKEAFRQDIFKDGDAWIAMLEDRNRTSHVYNEEQALEIYNKIKNQHSLKLDEFLKKSNEIISGIGE